jgi:hypothetical protein
VLGLVGCEPEPQVRSYTVAKASAPAAAAAPKATMPADPALVAQAAASGSPRYPAAPAGWTAKDPGAMRKGSWTVSGPGGDADLAVTVFPGDVGGRVANINRWRGQLGLPPGDAERFDAIALAQVGATQGEVVDLRSADGAQATVAILARKGDESWFLKLTGPAATVDAARSAFLAFAAATELP